MERLTVSVRRDLAGRGVAIGGFALGCALGCALVIRLWLFFHLSHLFVDDAYIFLRYARHAGRGNGLVYNTGERVMGFSSPLYTLVLSAMARVGLGNHLVGATLVMNLVLFALASVLLGLISRCIRISVALIIGWLFYFPFIAASVNGMETMLFMLVLFAVLYFVARRQYAWALVASALLALTRPEGALLAGLLFLAVAAWGSRRRHVVIGVGVGAMPVIAWLGFAWAYYGTVEPQSVVAKSVVSGASGGAVQKLTVLAAGLSTAQFNALSPIIRTALEAAALAAFALVVSNLVRRVREHSIFAVVPAWFIAVWAFYVVTNPLLIWSWYSVPTAFVVWWSATAEVQSMRPLAGRTASISAAALALCGVSILVGVPKRSTGIAQSTASLRHLGEIVRRDYPNARSLMLGDIGIVGWLDDKRIVDSSGLVTPAASATRNGRIASLASLVSTTHPDVVLLRLDPRRSRVSDPVLMRPFAYTQSESQSAFQGYVLRELPRGLDYTVALARSTVVMP